MNENINLCEILKDCPKGTKLYTPIVGEVEFCGIEKNSGWPILVKFRGVVLDQTMWFTKDGQYLNYQNAECLLFPSKDQRDWSKFKAPYLKKAKFDPKTLKPFDRVLVIDSDRYWTPVLFDHLEYSLNYPRMYCFDHMARKVIPYNDDTKHLVGTLEEAPEYYRYWEE